MKIPGAPTKRMMRASSSLLLLLAAVTLTVTGTTMTGAPPLANPVAAHAAERQVTQDNDVTYDYIIVGGGLAGCVLAERLSVNDPNKRILVLEAGRPDYNHLWIRMPAGILRLFRSVYDWQYESGGEKACHGRNIYLQRGKVLGGSSCTNVCLHHRGSAKDYDEWEVPGWTAADVLPFFLASQNDETGRSPNFHGKGGEWNMAEVRYQNPLSLTFLKVGEAAGLGTNIDFNDWSRPQDGVGRFQVSQVNGERCSGASAFLSKALKRPNVTVRTGTMVRRVNFNANKKANGVTYDLVGDDSYTLFHARLTPAGQVLLTGGAIASPQILMASGIGPAKHLRSHGIPVVVENPHVGDNLQDHPAVVVSFKTPAKGVSVTSKLRILGGRYTNPWPVLQWLFFKSGMLTSVGCDHGAFLRTTPTAMQPDLQFRFIPARALGPDGMTTYTQFRNSKSVEDGYTIQSVAIRAKSKGRVRLASSNTHVKPIIDGGYLNNPEDLATLREGIKLARTLCNRPEWGDYLGQEVFPGAHVQTDEQIDEYIRNSVHTANALTGTCKMGTGKDAVVGPDLCVLGVTGLRVCDSSVFPNIPGGQTATPTVMIADRAAHLILNHPSVPTSAANVEVYHQQPPTPTSASAIA